MRKIGERRKTAGPENGRYLALECYHVTYMKHYKDGMANAAKAGDMVKTVLTADTRPNVGDVLNGFYDTEEPVAAARPERQDRRAIGRKRCSS